MQMKAAVILVMLAVPAHAFSPYALVKASVVPKGHASSRHATAERTFIPVSCPSLRADTAANMFGWLKDAFTNAEYATEAEGVKATASHILVKSLEDVTEIKAQVEGGALTFADAAREFSTCPSNSKGGSLGNFKPGMMVPEFDEAVFGAGSDGVRSPVGEILGPVQTKFGYHLIKIESRSMPSKNVNGAFTEERAE